MKKINLFAISAAALLLAGCSNAFVDSNSAAEKAENVNAIVQENRKDGNTNAKNSAFKVSSTPSVSVATEGDNKVATVTITFNQDVKKDTVSAITVAAITDAAADTAVTETALTPNDVKVVDEKVSFTVKYAATATYAGLKIAIDSNVLTSTAGLKLNQDGDITAGEAADDNYLYYYGSFTGKTKKYADKELKISDATLSQVALTKGAVVVDITLNTKEDLSAALKGELKIEKYDTAAKTWNAIAYAGTYVAVGNTSTYKFAAQAGEGTIVRAYFANVQNIKTTTEKDDFGNVYKYTKDCSIVGELIGTTTVGDYATYKAEDYADLTGIALKAIIDSNNMLQQIVVTYSNNVTKADVDKFAFYDVGMNKINIAELNATNYTVNNKGYKSTTIEGNKVEYYTTVIYTAKTPVYVGEIFNNTVKAYAAEDMKVTSIATGKVVTKSVGLNNSNDNSKLPDSFEAALKKNITLTKDTTAEF